MAAMAMRPPSSTCMAVDEAHVELAAELARRHPHVVEDELRGVRGVQAELPVRACPR